MPRKNHEANLAEKLAISRRKSQERRDIGSIPPIANIRRRRRCRSSFRLFCETYNPNAWFYRWSPDHLTVIARIEEVVTHGAMYAFAMPRGAGKSTLCRMATLWAISYGLCRYVFIIGANSEKAEENLDAVKTYARYLPAYAEDFPEIAHPIISLGGIAHRAKGQTCEGESTLIEWSESRIVLPTVPVPPNWPKSWPKRHDGMAPTSGSVIRVSGLTGEGVRGSVHTTTTGESIRPDLVLLDDPQTDESANSVQQNKARLRIITGAVLGMAAPGKSLSALMPCTAIAPGDMVDTVLDRSKHPLWRGERTQMMRSMPKNMDAWRDYFDVYERCVLKTPPDTTEANAYYLANRDTLDEGAEASWPDRKGENDVSAIQHAMHLYFRSPAEFFAEYQNTPLVRKDNQDQIIDIKPEEVLGRLTTIPRGIVPRDCTRLTCGIDCGDRLLWYTIVAWDEHFGGSIIDYGVYPRQHSAVFNSSKPLTSIEDVYPELSEESRLHAAIQQLLIDTLGQEYFRQDASDSLTVGCCLVDSGDNTDTVHKAISQSIHRSIVYPSKGHAITAARKPMSDWSRKPGERAGRDWRISFGARGRLATLDPNSWKTFVRSRLNTPPGGRGALMLFGDTARDHTHFTEHLSAEYAVKTSGYGRELYEWKTRPGKPDNHWLDCLVYATVAASIDGLVWSAARAAGEEDEGDTTPKRLSLAEIQRRKRGQR